MNGSNIIMRFLLFFFLCGLSFLNKRREDGESMKYRLRDRIWDKIIFPILRKITGHEYGCCSSWKRCSRCEYTREDGEA